MIEKILTIGAYRYDAGTFIGALKAVRVDLFVDVRARRGMRGADYAFANAARLEAALAAAGIPYVHAKELAPSDAIRKRQQAADAAAGVATRARTRLSAAFVSAYRAQVLAQFDSRRFVEAYCGRARRPALFCVEHEPAACHRALLAERIARDLGVPMVHLRA